MVIWVIIRVLLQRRCHSNDIAHSRCCFDGHSCHLSLTATQRIASEVTIGLSLGLSVLPAGLFALTKSPWIRSKPTRFRSPDRRLASAPPTIGL